MDQKSVDVKILEAKPHRLKVVLPFVDVPISMNRDFFNSRLHCGYFRVVNPQVDRFGVTRLVTESKAKSKKAIKTPFQQGGDQE